MSGGTSGQRRERRDKWAKKRAEGQVVKEESSGTGAGSGRRGLEGGDCNRLLLIRLMIRLLQKKSLV